jgi:uncharacterized protein (DUF2236 family)
MLHLLPTAITLPWPLRDRLDDLFRALLEDGAHDAKIDFARPAGEPALLAPDSVSWRVFKNPLSVFIGGVTAVIMELAEPRVRAGVWDHTTFRSDPVRRLRRTGLAAMVTIYGPRSTAEAMIARVRRKHDAVTGVTPAGEAYRANDVALLDWVHATAAFGFLQAYHGYVRPLARDARDRFCAEGVHAAALYGATGAPRNEAELMKMFGATAERLDRSDIIFEFLAIMRTAPVLPLPLRPLQHMLVRAAVELVPRWLTMKLGLEGHGLRGFEAELVRQAGALADRIVIEASPAVQACRRMGLPADYLYLSQGRPRERGDP